MRERTILINALCCLLAEYSIVAAAGWHRVSHLPYLQRKAEDKELPTLTLEALRLLISTEI